MHLNKDKETKKDHLINWSHSLPDTDATNIYLFFFASKVIVTIQLMAYIVFP